MSWQVAGLRERSYLVETADQVSAWVADEIDFMSRGWVPLSSERTSGGSLRVTYGMLPPELGRPASAGAPSPSAPADVAPPSAAVLGGVAMLLAVLGLATAFGLLPHL